MRPYLIVALLLMSPASVWPQSVDMISDDLVIEARLKALSTELRCLVCQNETLADSRADLAIDLRNEIRGLLAQNYSDQQVIEYLVARYGDFVRFRPPVKLLTLPLWFGPFILGMLGVGLLIYYLKRLSARANNAPLSELEHKRLDALLSKTEQDTKP